MLNEGGLLGPGELYPEVQPHEDHLEDQNAIKGSLPFVAGCV